mmetsp:Transcript_125461/g.362966  ORF Transcript_125461/g.362966 Transcript_125461/m.362966 type:complete len:255 (+) Transcript_125461:1148-1912(+)
MRRRHWELPLVEGPARRAARWRRRQARGALREVGQAGALVPQDRAAVRVRDRRDAEPALGAADGHGPGHKVHGRVPADRGAVRETARGARCPVQGTNAGLRREQEGLCNRVLRFDEDPRRVVQHAGAEALRYRLPGVGLGGRAVLQELRRRRPESHPEGHLGPCQRHRLPTAQDAAYVQPPGVPCAMQGRGVVRMVQLFLGLWRRHHDEGAAADPGPEVRRGPMPEGVRDPGVQCAGVQRSVQIEQLGQVECLL